MTKIYIYADNRTQRICPVEAENEEQARGLIEERVNYEIGDAKLLLVDDTDPASMKELDKLLAKVGKALRSDGDINED
jgi:hypothetical protein